MEITEYIVFGDTGVLVRTSVRSMDNYTWATALEFMPLTGKKLEQFIADRAAEADGE